MFLSNRDIKWAIACDKLIVAPPPEYFNAGYDESSIDLHLDAIQRGARVWDIERYRTRARPGGARREAEIELGSFQWEALAGEYLIEVPREADDEAAARRQLVFRRDDEVVVRPLGFLLWTTKERVGTPAAEPRASQPQRHPELICFVNAKSTKARTGVMVHFTAPTIHAGWAGHITLEITNLGPFDFVLREGDAIAQLTVATISSAPDLGLRKGVRLTQGQTDPSGAPRRTAKRGGRKPSAG
jgi:dCTP deaminase